MSDSKLSSTASGERIAPVGELKLCYETFGDRRAPAVLLVMGQGSQMIMWEEEFCELLAARGFRVIRFDNRDVGRSTILRGARIPSRWQLLRRKVKAAAYSLDDMADDTAGLLDRMGIRSAHLVGTAMGGMIAQLMAISRPERTLSLVSIMSTTGDRAVGGATRKVARRIVRRTKAERERYIEDQLETYRMIGSPGFEFDEERQRELTGRCFDRGIYPAAGWRQMAAVRTARDRTPALRGLNVPTTVIHGDADPLIDVSGGRATAAAIPGAELVIHSGMGHDLPRELWPQIIDAIAQNAARSSA